MRALLSLVLRGTVAATAVALAAATPPPRAEPTLNVGRMTLHRCTQASAWCGPLLRSLDPAGGGGQIAIYFEYYPHSSAGPAAGTLVATEGGPGFPATASRDEYLSLFAPLRNDHDVLIMDNRGTGRSAAIDCPVLQQAPALTVEGIGACGRFLGARAHFFGTAFAADDLEALLEALALERVSLYGDSYGTYTAQVFALRHPRKLRALILDGAYPLDDDPWYPGYAPAMRNKFDRACERVPACRALRGSAIEHIAPALALLRRAPFAAQVRYGDGRFADFTASASALATVMFGSSPPYATLRETDAAARAFTAGDRVPLLRLMAETLSSVDSREATRSPQLFSAGLEAAVFCEDERQIFDMALAPERRRAALANLIAQRKAQAPDTYAPFTIDEYRGLPPDYAYIDQCVDWPAVPQSAVALTLAHDRYPGVPVLVVSGELDNITTVAEGAAAAAHFPHAHHVVIANGFHVNALPHGRSACAAQLVRRFIETLSTGDESCAASVPEVRLVPRFARHVGELAPAAALPGNAASEDALRGVTAVLLTSEDVIARARDNGAGEGIGLRGGSFSVVAAGEGYRLELRGVRWCEDLAVSGRIDWPGRSGSVHASLELAVPAGTDGKLEAGWAEGVSSARATVHGILDGKRVSAEAPAP
jgi:pimeloyl-ACP methyl ester carboxylesterase